MRSNVLRVATFCLLIPIGSALSWGADATTPRLPWEEAENLCAEVRQTGWKEISRESALALAPTLKEDIEKTDDAGLLRGFLAVALQDTTCAEPPADVLAEALRYLDQFLPAGTDRLDFGE